MGHQCFISRPNAKGLDEDVKNLIRGQLSYSEAAGRQALKPTGCRGYRQDSFSVWLAPAAR